MANTNSSLEAPVGGRQPEKFAQPEGLIVGKTGVKEARKTGRQARATEAIRMSVNDRME